MAHPGAVSGSPRVPKAGELLAASLRQAIFDGEIQVGSYLIPERALAVETGLGRASVREALKSLEAEGLISSTVGRHGGYVVQKPPRDAVVRSLESFIRGGRISAQALLEVRRIVEPECAALAAVAGTPAEIDLLDRMTAELAGLTDDVARFLDTNILWHTAIAEASHNPILAAVMTAISKDIRIAIGAQEYDSPGMLRQAQRLHELIAAAIRERDPEAARRRMQRHLAAAAAVLETDRRVAPESNQRGGGAR